MNAEDLAFCESLPTQRQRDLCSGRLLPDGVMHGEYLAHYRSLQTATKPLPRLPCKTGIPKPGTAPAIRFNLQPKPSRGPGTELKKLLATLGVDSGWCESCSKRRETMDAWGVDGCREHLDEIVAWMKQAEISAATRAAEIKAENENRLATTKDIERERNALKRAATWNALKSCTWVNPLDPHRSLVLKAIEAAANE